MPSAAAVLAVGYGLGDGTVALTSLVAHIGESLLANAGSWRVRRLSPLAGERDGADRASLKRHITELCEAEVDTILIALAGNVVTHNDEPCLVTGADVSRYPEDATLPLTWIRDRLRTCRADRVVVVASLESSADEDWLDALGTGRARHVVVTERSERRALALAALLDGVRGSAIDPRTGTITLRSLGEHLARVTPHARLQLSTESLTLASSPPLAGPWDARLTSRAEPRTGTEEALVGTVLPGRFEIVRELARGSFGNVYLARQLSVNREVAVKVLHGAIAPGSEAGRLFVHEIQSVGRLDHPNIVRIHQADITAGGSLFYAMELLAGRDLQDIIERDGPMEPERAVALARQLATALGAAHDVGLVHADVKPANAMVVAGKPDERLVLLDFGLARLRGTDAAVSAGGTPAFMSPEQLRDGRVDARSDVFSAALVLVALLTGWRRRTAEELVPPLDGVSDPHVRAVLAKALSLSPGERHQNGADLAAALARGGETQNVSAVKSPPFRHLAAFTEEDRDRLYGRDQEIATLVEHVLFRRAVVYTAPSGTGKTSVLRAGLVPRLEAIGAVCIYVACHGREAPDLARAIWPDGDGAAAAAALRLAKERKRLVIIIDQVEAAITSAEFAAQLRALDRATVELELGVVFSVREDVLASLLAQLGSHTNVLRLGPLTTEAARDAIVRPLLERRVTLDEELLASLLADLQRAAGRLAAELRWTVGNIVYPPHLQLAGSALYDQLGPGEEVLALRHYKQLGGLDEIVRDYLERVLETELPAEQVATARRVLLALVDSDRTRAVRTYADLTEQLGGDVRLTAVLEALRQRGIVVPLRAVNGQPAWELVHDSLVPRVLAWSDRQDLDRQRALEIVRHHLRGSRGDKPSLLNGHELRVVKDHEAAIEELDREWVKRGPVPWTPVSLVEKSRRVRRTLWLAIVTSAAVALGVAGFFGVTWFNTRQEALLVQADMGNFALELHAFDWDAKTLHAIPVAVLEAGFDWTLHDPSPEDELSPNEAARSVERVEIESDDPLGRAWQLETRGGKAVLVVSRRGCADSTIPLESLPGYWQRHSHRRLTVAVPTCEASRRDMIEIEGGPYISGGRGEPPVPAIEELSVDEIPPERTVDLPRFAMDRTEVPNAAYEMFTSRRYSTAVAMPAYPVASALTHAAKPNYPVAQVTWLQARAYCRFLGKDLPTQEQWQKAMRGGLQVRGQPNPMPRRTVPWGLPTTFPANLKDTGHEQPAPIDANPGDISPYGIIDLAGNVMEWTRTLALEQPEFYSARGCSWGYGTIDILPTVLAVSNIRTATVKYFDLGFRCVAE